MRDPKVKSHIQIEDRVIITRFVGDKHTLTGKVIEILESEDYNKDGVEVVIDSGFSGYVTEILDNWPTKNELEKMICEHETDYFELKASFCVHMQDDHTKVDLILVLAREIVAFFNSKDGGYICLGVTNEPKIIGLAPDYDRIRNSNQKKWSMQGQSVTQDLLRDSLQLAINDGIRKFIYKHPRTFNLEMKFYKFGDNDLCLIKLEPQKTPVYVAPTKDYKAVEFRVRVGTTKQNLNIPDSVEYIQNNFDRATLID